MPAACGSLRGKPAVLLVRPTQGTPVPVEPEQEALDDPSIPRLPQSVEKKQQSLSGEDHCEDRKTFRSQDRRLDEMSSPAEEPEVDVEGVDSRATRQAEGRIGEPGQISIVSSRNVSCIQLFQIP